jgi:hypothetical protein
MILSRIEENVKDGISEALSEKSIAFILAHGVAAAGEVYGEEKPGVSAFAAIAATGPAFSSYDSSIGEISVAVVVSVRFETDPAHERVRLIADELERWALKLQLPGAPDRLSALSCDGFDAGGFLLSKGVEIIRVADSSAESIVLNFSVKGACSAD